MTGAVTAVLLLNSDLYLETVWPNDIAAIGDARPVRIDVVVRAGVRGFGTRQERTLQEQADRKRRQHPE